MQAKQSPCPHRCFDDLGSAYAMGCLGGAVWHGLKGLRNAPRGDRLRGGYQQIVLRAPALGGNFAVWGGLFSAFDCGITSVRQKEDPLNAISAGFLTGGVLAIRAGPKAAFLNAMIGGALLGLIEGLGFVMGRMTEAPTGAAAAAPPGMSKGVATVGMFGAGPALAPKNDLAGMQPRRTLRTALDDPTAAVLSLDDEDTSVFRSASATSAQSEATSAAATSSSSSSSGVRSLLFPSAWSTSARDVPVYAAAPEFSSDDFAFNDADDFDEEH